MFSGLVTTLLTSHPRSTVVLLETGTPGTSRDHTVRMNKCKFLKRSSLPPPLEPPKSAESVTYRKSKKCPMCKLK